ncbi:hypothetical protein [Moheibacter stercoris]|uniref:Lipoprotein n=1 Tax=Moheibacter stercoris TaxID=1628251 RepID=A0ABV2LSA9_9FLAO
MKTNLYALTILFFSCNNGIENKNLEEDFPIVEEVLKPCTYGVQFGDIDVCIPEFNGYKNIYNNEHSDLIDFLESNEHPSNQLIAAFVNDISYKEENYKTFNDSDYFKIYSVKNYRNKFSNSKDLQKIFNIHNEGFVSKNWDYVNGKMKEVESELELDKPILLESYKTNENFYTLVFLLKYNMEAEEKIMVGTMNILLIKNRIIHFAYYLKYNEENQAIIKQKNNYIGLRILDENN